MDRIIQRWRFRVASKWIPRGSRLLDIGAHDGDFLSYLGTHIDSSVGIDPETTTDSQVGQHALLAGFFPQRAPEGRFDAISLLAVVEHLDDSALSDVGRALLSLLEAGGRVIVTIPSPAADGVLELMQKVHLIHGMDLEAHHQLTVDALVAAWSQCGFRASHRGRFQLGLNNVVVFEPDPPARERATSSREQTS